MTLKYFDFKKSKVKTKKKIKQKLQKKNKTKITKKNKKGGSNNFSECTLIGYNPALKKCKSLKDDKIIYSYIFNEKRLAMSWNINIYELKKLFNDLELEEIKLTELGKKFFSNKISDKGIKCINEYYINDYLKDKYDLDIKINYSGKLKDFNNLVKNNIINQTLTLYKPEDINIIPDNIGMLRKRKYLSNMKYISTFDKILEKESFEKYIIRCAELIDFITSSSFHTYFTKIGLNDESLININGSVSLFYFKRLSMAYTDFHRNKLSKNRINIYIETSGYNKLDLQFTAKNDSKIEEDLIKIIDTDETNVVWWNDHEIQHRSPIGLTEENIPRIFLVLEFDYDKCLSIFSPNNQKNDNEMHESNIEEENLLKYVNHNYIYGKNYNNISNNSNNNKL